MKVGDTVEDFALVDQSGQTVTFDSLITQGPLVIYFYIKAMTPG